MKEEAFAETYNRYAVLVKKSVMAQTNNEDLAEEICQSVFVSLFRHIDRIDEDYVKAWLLRATKNKVIDYWRKASTRLEISSEYAQRMCEGQLLESDMEKRYANRQLICELLKDLKDTNFTWYQVIDCVCVRQMSHEEAERALGISPGVLRSRLYRARIYIQEKYGKEYENT